MSGYSCMPGFLLRVRRHASSVHLFKSTSLVTCFLHCLLSRLLHVLQNNRQSATDAHTHTGACTHTHMHTNKHTHIGGYTHMHTQKSNTYTPSFMYIHIHRYIYTQREKHTHTGVCIHTYTYMDVYQTKQVNFSKLYLTNACMSKL